jgi:radical SAM protein with 4Fe4S-binding SPASM domain
MNYVRAVKERGMGLAMNTNGLTFRRPMAEFFVEVGLDAVCFSIDATTKETLKKVRGVDKLDKIHRAIELMLEVRGDHKLPRVGASFVIQPANRHEEKTFVERWAPKVDFVRTSQLFEAGGFPAITLQSKRTPCSALYNTMAIHANGNVSYCCLDGFGETSVGNVFEEGVRGVWHGDKLNEVRHYHETGQWDKVPFCKKCDRWASYEFEETIRDGLLIRSSPEYTYYNRIDRLDNWGGTLLGNHPDPQESLEKLKIEK